MCEDLKIPKKRFFAVFAVFSCIGECIEIFGFAISLQ